MKSPKRSPQSQGSGFGGGGGAAAAATTKVRAKPGLHPTRHGLWALGTKMENPKLDCPLIKTNPRARIDRLHPGIVNECLLYRSAFCQKRKKLQFHLPSTAYLSSKSNLSLVSADAGRGKEQP